MATQGSPSGGATGGGDGFNTGSTTLSSSHIPSHTHGVGTLATVSAKVNHDHYIGQSRHHTKTPIIDYGASSGDLLVTYLYSVAEKTEKDAVATGICDDTTHSHSISGSTAAWGTASPSGHSHSIDGSKIIPKYYTCYIFRRTA